MGCNHRWKRLFRSHQAFHNALHGKEYKLTRQAQEIFLSYNEQNRQRMHFDEDVVVIHDPQPAPLVCGREGGRKNHWIWRCHIDLSNPNHEVWGSCARTSSALTPLFSLRNHSHGSCRFLSTCFIRVLTHSQRRTENWMRPLSRRSATTSTSIEGVRLSHKFRALIA